jgi:hypothetical protein
MQPRSFMSVENYTRHWKDVPVIEVKRALRCGQIEPVPR